MRLLQTLHLQKLMCYSSPSFTFKAPQSRSHCTLTGTFIQLFTSSVQWPKAFLLGIQSGRWWAVHNQSLLRLMTILDTPWKRETPGYWLVPSQVSQLSQISHFKQIIFFLIVPRGFSFIVNDGDCLIQQILHVQEITKSSYGLQLHVPMEGDFQIVSLSAGIPVEIPRCSWLRKTSVCVTWKKKWNNY